MTNIACRGMAAASLAIVLTVIGCGGAAGGDVPSNDTPSVPSGGKLRITASSLTTLIEGQTANETVLASGGVNPLTWTLSGAPNWLTIGTVSGTLRGTVPAGAAAMYSITVNVEDASQPTPDVTSRVLDLVVTAPPSPPPPASNIRVKTTELPVAVEGEDYGMYMTASGESGQYLWSMAPNAAAWLSIDAATGWLSGNVPGGIAAANPLAVSITVTDTTDSLKAATKNFSLAVKPAGTLTFVTTSLPDAHSGVAYSAPIEVTGGSGTGYAFLPQPVGIRQSGGMVLGPPPGIDITLNPGGPISTYAGTPWGAGVYRFRVEVTDSLSNTAIREYSLTVLPGLEVVTAAIPNPTQNVPFSFAIKAQGGKGPYTWTVAAGSTLPPGLNLLSATPDASLEGIPTWSALYTFDITVTDTLGTSVTHQFGVNVAATGSALDIRTAVLDPAAINAPYDGIIAATGGTGITYAWSVPNPSALPPGLTVGTTGTPYTTIQGTPTSSGTFNFDVQVTDAMGVSQTETIQLTVNPTSLLTTFAGTGQSGDDGDGGPAVDAMLTHPAGIAITPNGDCYIALSHSKRIRKIDSSGFITTVCGSGVDGSSTDGLSALNTSMVFPFDVAVGANGDVFYIEFTGGRLRKASSANVVTTLTSTYFGIGAEVDRRGNVYYSIPLDNKVYRVVADPLTKQVGPTSTIETFLGRGAIIDDGDGGTAANAGCVWANMMCFDAAGNFYAATNNGTVRKVAADPNGNVSPQSIVSTVMTGVAGLMGVAVDTAGNVYGAAYDARTVYHCDPQGNVTALPFTFSQPHGIAVDAAGDLYVCEWDAERVTKIDRP